MDTLLAMPLFALTSLGVVLLVLVILLLIGAVPVWPHSREWGPYPAGGLLVTILLVVFILWLLGVTI